MSIAERLGLRAGHWPVLYIRLALFNVVTVVSGLLLSHRQNVLFDESVAVNKAWNQRQLSYSTLGQLASAVNAPANDIFADENVTAELLAGAQQNLEAALIAFRRALETGEPFAHDERIIRRDGVERISHAVGEVVRDADGRPVRMVGSAQYRRTPRRACSRSSIARATRSRSTRKARAWASISCG